MDREFLDARQEASHDELHPPSHRVPGAAATFDTVDNEDEFQSFALKNDTANVQVN